MLSLENLEARLRPMEWEAADNPSRLNALCRDSQMATECALKALVHLYGYRPPENTHDLESLCLALPRDMARSVDRLLKGIDKKTMSKWRYIGTYPANYPDEAAQAPALAEPYVCAAVALNRYAAIHIEARVGAHPELDRHQASLDRISDHLDDHQLKTALPRTGPTPSQRSGIWLRPDPDNKTYLRRQPPTDDSGPPPRLGRRAPGRARL